MKTDDMLKRDVTEELAWEPTLASHDISVKATDGVITLTGTVPTYAQKWSAERAAQRVCGVKSIAEEIVVRPHRESERSDTDTAHAVVQVLEWNVWVPRDIKSMVQEGWVTLMGSVEWGYERTAAEEAVRNLFGVRGVNNTITLKPSVKPTEVQGAIERALRRNAEVDAEDIDVPTMGTQVTLAGRVKSWDERREAGEAAWSAPGVTWVENRLAVTFQGREIA